jgi:hypothetical protein
MIFQGQEILYIELFSEIWSVGTIQNWFYFIIEFLLRFIKE